MGEAAAEELAALSKGLIFFDVDTQRDFCWKNLGKDVYNPGAEKLAEKWGKLLGAARKARLRIFGDVDSHTEKDPELKRNGGRFDDHCFPLDPWLEACPGNGAAERALRAEQGTQQE